MRFVDEFRFVVELHVKARVSFVQTERYAVFGLFIGRVQLIVFHAQACCISECQEWLELECCGRVCFNQSIFDENSVFVCHEYLFLCQDNATDTVSKFGYSVTIEFSQIFVSVRTVHTVFITVNSQIEWCTVLYHRLIQRRKQHKVIVVHLLDRDDQQSMLFARVTTGYCSAMISSCFVRSKNLLWERLVKVNQQVFIKFKVTHIVLCFGVILNNG